MIFRGLPHRRLEWEGIALQVKSFIHQAEKDHGRENGRDRDEGLEP
jgi:hypothetical protein